MPEAGPKPTYQVVESKLMCQTSQGELAIDLRISYEAVKRMMDFDEIPWQQIPDIVGDEILRQDDREKLAALYDGIERMGILMKVSKVLSERLGVSLGESSPSSASSGSTEPPSDTTSDTASESDSTPSE